MVAPNFVIVGCVTCFITVTWHMHSVICPKVNRIKSGSWLRCTGNVSLEECRESKLPPGLTSLSPDVLPLKTNMTFAKAEQHFFNHVNVRTKAMTCNPMQKLGKPPGRERAMCVAGPYWPTPPCVVYSFGMHDDWSFEDAMSSEFGCQVRSFKPGLTMEPNGYEDRKLVTSSPFGTRRKNNENKHGGTLKTLGILLEQFGETERVIDFLKMDIKSNVWEGLEAAQHDGSLRNVKQLAVAAHMSHIYQSKQTGAAQFMRNMHTLQNLEDQGFRLWHSHPNTDCGYFQLELSKKNTTYCHELYYINTNFLLI